MSKSRQDAHCMPSIQGAREPCHLVVILTYSLLHTDGVSVTSHGHDNIISGSRARLVTDELGKSQFPLLERENNY